MDGSPAWAPDGQRIAFARYAPHYTRKLVVADARGRLLWSLTPEGEIADAPAWSPDGRQIVYVSGYDETSLKVVDSLTGVVQTRLSKPYSSYYTPSWAPDGGRLAFRFAGINERVGVYTARLDGTDRRLVALDAAYPAWSPDGTKLAYVRFGQETLSLVVSNVDGGAETVVAEGLFSSFPSAPAWSPDGTRLAFGRTNRAGTTGWSKSSKPPRGSDSRRSRSAACSSSRRHGELRWRFRLPVGVPASAACGRSGGLTTSG